LAAVLASVLLSACGTSVNLKVDVDRSGAGSVTLVVSFPQTTAAGIEDLKTGLPVADLRAAGWVVDGPRPGPGGSTEVSATHSFSNLSEVPALVADVAGSGTESKRPFRLAVTEQSGFLQDRFMAAGSVDLQCSISCFADPHLAQSVGYALGLAPSEVHQLLGSDPGNELKFRVEVLLPGRLTSSNGSSRAGKSGAIWVPVLGNATPVAVSSVRVDVSRLRGVFVAVNAGALVVLTTAAYLLWRRRRRPKSGLAALKVRRRPPRARHSWR
jgi:hypothetical protein